MKAAAGTSEPALETAHSKIGDVLVLMKVRVNALVVATTAGGFFLGASGPVEWLPLILTCLGTTLVASGAAAINQVDERDTDRLMTRTQRRPVAEGRMAVGEGRLIAAALTLGGLTTLVLGANAVAAAVAAATFVWYAWAYTPLKRRTSLATIVGAVPGALPPLIGWAAASGTVAGAAPWSLFLIMFVWQLPHFLAIAWIYRDEYARAGLPMLPVVDITGAVTGRQATVWAAALLPVSQLPFLFGVSNGTYAVGALILSALQLAIAAIFGIRRTTPNARRLFYASITFLPLLWALMVIGKS